MDMDGIYVSGTQLFVIWVGLGFLLLLIPFSVAMVLVWLSERRTTNELRSDLSAMNEYVRRSDADSVEVFGRLSTFLAHLAEEMRVGHIRIETRIQEEAESLHLLVENRAGEIFRYAPQKEGENPNE